ncbi:GTPase-activating protein RacGAP84C [Sergentomyia squamirostris]
MSEPYVDLSILALFDDLTRCTSVLTDGAAEEVFLDFLKNYMEIKKSFHQGNEEIRRLQHELDDALTNISDLERKLNNARRLHDQENQMRKKAEGERDDLERKMRICREVLWKDVEGRDEETRSKLAFLNSPRRGRSFLNEHTIDEEEDDRRRIGYGNTTGSLLSDMSVTVSEEDFLEHHREKPQKRTKSRRSDANVSLGNSKRFRLSSDARNRSSHRAMEIDVTDKIVASTKVTVPQSGDGPIVAESIIEARPSVEEHVEHREPEPEKFYTPAKKAKSPSRRVKPMAPSAPPMEDFTSLETATPARKKHHEEVVYATVHKPSTPSSVQRTHHWMSHPMFFGTVTCAHCTKKMKGFGAGIHKCRDCRVLVHATCTENYTMCCVPPSSGARDGKGTLTNFTPTVGPMVPHLIVYCVNEIETRGLNEVGIYRVSGSEKEVKALKEKFLRGNSLPQLKNVDIHVLCGTIKDFLRSLPEPLIPKSQWTEFSNAIQQNSRERVQAALFEAVERMPQANRDTIAFLIQHFQHVAEEPEVKMPIGNIAKVFAPTIVGYSSKTVTDQHTALAEITVQVGVMEALLNIPTEYWMRYVMYDFSNGEDHPSSKTPSRYLITPTSKPRKEKYYDTPPYHPRRK